MKNVPQRHGDMFLLKVSKDAVKNLKSVARKNLPVGLGEVTGHCHNIKPFAGTKLLEYATDEEFNQEKSNNNDFIEREKVFFEVKGNGAVIHHEDHDPMILDEGVYVRLHQDAYDPLEKKIRRVAD